MSNRKTRWTRAHDTVKENFSTLGEVYHVLNGEDERKRRICWDSKDTRPLSFNSFSRPLLPQLYSFIFFSKTNEIDHDW